MGQRLSTHRAPSSPLLNLTGGRHLAARAGSNLLLQQVKLLQLVQVCVMQVAQVAAEFVGLLDEDGFVELLESESLGLLDSFGAAADCSEDAFFL